MFSTKGYQYFVLRLFHSLETPGGDVVFYPASLVSRVHWMLYPSQSATVRYLKHLRTWLMHILSAKMGPEICSISVTLFRPSFSSFGHLGDSFGQPGSKNKARNFERFFFFFFFFPLADWCVFSCLPSCAVLLFTFALCMALSNQQWKWKLRAQAVLAELEEPASWSLREFSFPPPFLHSVALGSALPASSSCFCLLYW